MSAAAPRRESRHDDGGAAVSSAGVARATTEQDGGAARFAEIWDRRVASPPSPDAQTVYGELRRRYDEPFRQYHNLRHILDCLRLCDEIGPLLADRDAVEIALWFHDAVYDRGASTNELRSAELFLSFSTGASFMFRHRVCDHILATRHSTTVSDSDRRFLVDIDLSGFGAPWDEFMRNGALLREECNDQDDVRYHFGQVAFLSRLQERRHFFATDYFRARYEATARDNLRRVLAELRAQGYGTTAPPSL
jgi:predicted metal-dependent HD superfamily phosphohydrolase